MLGIELSAGSHMMLSMQYLNPRRPYKKPNFPNSKSSRDRRFSGTFIPEHHVIAMPTLVGNKVITVKPRLLHKPWLLLKSIRHKVVCLLL